MQQEASWPPSWVGWWVAADGKAVLIEISEEKVLVSVAPDRSSGPYESAILLAGDVKRIENLEASVGFDDQEGRFLEIEAGSADVGPTYRLFAACELSPGTLTRADDAQNVADVILVPTTSMGLYDDQEDDLGVPWALPLEPLRWTEPGGCSPETEEVFPNSER